MEQLPKPRPLAAFIGRNFSHLAGLTPPHKPKVEVRLDLLMMELGKFSGRNKSERKK